MISKSNKKSGGVPNQSIPEIIREGDSRFDPSEEKGLKKEDLQKQLEQFQFIQNQDRLIFVQKHQKEEEKIKSILEEIKELSKSVKNLDKEVEKAVEQTPVEPGIYHLTFFEKLKEGILLIKKQVEEAATWLEIFNKRNTKKKNYWAQFKKTGTQWSMSGERYVATSVG